MITDVYIVYNDELQLSILNGDLKQSPFFHLINSKTKQGKRKAFTLKSEYGAKLEPFVLVTDKDKPLIAFYSETGENVIENLINYINNYE